MQHPQTKCQENQEEFLKNCLEEEREYHATLFRIGNATFKYHLLAAATGDDKLRLFYIEWLQGLPDNIRVAMQKRGYEECKEILSFTRYVNERNNIGLRDWLKGHLSEEDFASYQAIAAGAKE